MGFKPALERIVGALPRAGPGGRQTVLYSATLPRDVLDMVSTVTHRHEFVDCVGEDESETNVQVHQEHLIVPLLSVVPGTSHHRHRCMRCVNGRWVCVHALTHARFVSP
jgi:superfamily II DNA/RNA helicase